MNRKYQSYKQTGVEWIGEIPSHWDFIKTNILTENLDGKRVPLNSEERGEMEGEYPYWGSNGIVDYVNQFIFNEEIVLVGEDGSPFFDKLKDVSFYVNEPVWVNNHIHILKPKERILPRYLTHSFNCVDYKEYITGSTRDKLTQSDLKRISHCVPPLQEQQQIIQFLDEKTELIDKLISTKERKVTLLIEQRTSLINEVVTKGLNPNVKMKDSGVEWIGKIPEFWVTKKMKYLVQICNGSDFKDFTLEEGGFPVYGSGGEFSRSSKFIYDKISVLLGRKGSVDKPKIVNEPFWCSDTTYYTKIKDGVNPYFFFFLVQQIDFKRFIYGSTIPSMTKSVYDEMEFPYPSINEQNEIVEFLDSKTKEIDDLVQLEQKKIDLLKEYRQSLISEVVTGKVKVTQ
jgi:type I restriction enzyme S subunit